MALQENRTRTRALVQAQSIVSGRHRRRGKLPRQGSWKLIAKEYGEQIARMVSRDVIRDAFRELLDELPELIASARRERSDAIYDVCSHITWIEDPAERVRTWIAVRANKLASVRIDANEGKRARELIAKAKEKLRAGVSTRLIEDLAEKFAERTSTFQRLQLGRQVKAALGVDVMYGDKGLRTRFSNFASENVALIRNISDEVAIRVEKITTRALTSATPHGDLAETLNDEFGFGEKRAKLIARDQVGKLYGQINASRQQQLGVSRFRWRTVGDERVRGDPGGKYPDADSSHYDWDGEIFSYDDPPKDEDGNPVLPGEPVLCRCWAEPVLEDILDDEE